MTVDVITSEENDRRRWVWRSKHALWIKRGRKGYEPQFYPRASYTVVYDEPDEHGFWGRRLEAYFSVQGDTPHEERSAHEQVRAYFIETMDGRQHKIYSVDV